MLHQNMHEQFSKFVSLYFSFLSHEFITFSQLHIIKCYGIIFNSVIIFLKTTIAHPDNLPPKVSIFVQNWNAVWLKKACTRISMAREAEFGGKAKRRKNVAKKRSIT